MNVHRNSELESAEGADINALGVGLGQALTAQSDAQETPRSALRASDLNLMTERGEEENGTSPQHPPPSIFLPSRRPGGNRLPQDPMLGSLAHLQKPMDAEDIWVDVQLSENCASGQHSRQPSGLEDDLIHLRIRSNQKTTSKTARKPVNQGPQQQQLIEEAQAQAPAGGQGHVKQPGNTIRHSQSLDPLARSSAPGDQDVGASVTDINMTSHFKRTLGPSASQPPQTGFQPMMSSREKLSLVKASAWRSPVRTSSVGNIGLLSSHLKLNRRLLSGTHRKS